MRFGELHAGERFKLVGQGESIYEKISGNFADRLSCDGTILDMVEIPEGQDEVRVMYDEY